MGDARQKAIIACSHPQGATAEQWDELAKQTPDNGSADSAGVYSNLARLTREGKAFFIEEEETTFKITRVK